MRFLDNGPDVPEELIRSQLSGEALFVVGAGVSKRVGLPLFDDLTRDVYAAINQATPDQPATLADIAEKDAWDARQWDRVLGLLEKRIVYPTPNVPEIHNPIRNAVGQILQAGSRNLTPHKNILAVSSDSSGRPRIVTTNFDTLFERAWRRLYGGKPRTFSGPGLPAVGAPEFHGIIHLHGRIDDRHLGLDTTDLVLTSADFGEAYLRSGWASRFVYDLLRRYTLVFVGYAADDPPMRYMLEATEAGRLKFPDLKKAYAFADVGVTDNDGDVRVRWRAKGLDPILYQNGDGSYGALYSTLMEWANFSKDRRGWADQVIKTIAASPFCDTNDELRAKVQFLVETVSDVDTLAKRAASPDWIECRVKKGQQTELAYRDAIVWLRHWSGKVETAKWGMAIAAQPVATTIASAASQILEFSKPEPDELLRRFWRLYHVAFSDQLGPQGRVNWLSLQKRLKSGEANYFTISGITEIVQPALRLREPWSRLLRQSEADPDKPTTLSDLCRVEYECQNWPNGHDLLSAFPDVVGPEVRLLDALTSVLSKVCGLARDIDTISNEGDAVSRNVGLVHKPTDSEVAFVLDDPLFHRGTPNHQDDYNHSFAPITRLMSGIWSRLAKKDRVAAAAVARTWIGHEALLLRRLGYWAATVVDDGLVADGDRYLHQLNRATFWRRELTAEAARFWCRRWNRLAEKTRSKLEHVMRQGPQLNWIWSGTTGDQRHEIVASMAHRELRRVATAGGRLSRVSRRHMRQLEEQYPRFGKKVPLYSGLYSVSWSSYGPTGDPTSVTSAPVATLLTQVDAAIAADPFRQRDLWSIICRDRLSDAFDALKQAGARGNWPADKWRGVINQFVMAAMTIPKGQIAELMRELLKMPGPTVAELLPSVGQWFTSIPKKIESKAHRRAALRLWDKLATITEDIADDPAKQNSGRDLANESLGEPSGQLADFLSTLQGETPRRAGSRLAPDLAPRFNRLVALQTRQKIFALARFVQSLAFYNWLDPDWTNQHLFTALDADTSEARELLETLMLYGSYNQIVVVNRLKQRIFAAVQSENISNDARDRLAALVTWMAIRKLSGHADVQITEAEARQLLTRAPSGALRSVAWTLWLSLSKVKQGKQKAHWLRYIKPYLEKVWPNDISTRDAAISENLVRIPAVTGAAFPDAVKVITDLVVPFKVLHIETGLGVDENEAIMTRHAGSLLELAIASIDLSAPPPYDLQEFLEKLAKHEPKLKSDARFQKLNALLHGG